MPNNTDREHLVVPWRVVAFAAISVAIVAIAALAIVASVNDASSLETIALALAVLAFVVQILVFLGQTTTQSQQSMRSEDLHSRTLGILADISATSESTTQALQEQKEVLLPALIEKTQLQSET